MKKLLAACCSMVLASPAVQAAQAVLLGPDLEPRVISLRSFSEQGFEVIDRKGQEQTIPATEVLRLTFDQHAKRLLIEDDALDSAAQQREDAPGTAQLRDGQVLRGRLHAIQDEETFVWRCPGIGDVALSLDELLTLRFSDTTPFQADGDDDLLRLANGEVLAGFIDTLEPNGPGLSDDTIGFVIGDADDPIDLVLSRIDALAVANKPKPAESAAGWVRVERLDGTMLLLERADLSREAGTGPELRGAPLLEVQAPELRFELGNIYRIEPLAGQYRLAPLTDYAMDLLAGGEVFGVAMPPSREADGSIRLHAPTTIGYQLPEAVSRLAMTVALDLGDNIPEQRRRLAGCELVIYDGEAAVGYVKLSPDSPRHRVNIELNSSELRIELKPGVNGPVLDRVRLLDAEVLVGRP